ncbi:hypothetical protein FN846DRAFT_911936 [Sphaerosporella brunnea]|uniref:Ankyrin repeat-containing domain protein n=1 Tax=Sphaerosporella brunnea TaxID=1250544 RepID=A0A5J5EHU4_9PEZI|nr:hypothetical protein FN846DRAFT_911936 [Sphaerosporella brunnea]
MRELLEMSEKVSLAKPLKLASEMGHNGALDETDDGVELADSDVGIALCMAAANGHVETVARCWENAPTHDDLTPLHHAAASGWEHVVRALLSDQEAAKDLDKNEDKQLTSWTGMKKMVRCTWQPRVDI